MNEKERDQRSTICGLLFLIIATLTCHLCFSWMGFNPTDDGVVLAASRRLCDGQVPHRDFISIRPVGSSLVHLPWLLIGGDQCISQARMFVWFEFAVVAWVWTSMVNLAAGKRFSDWEMILLAATGTLLSAHTFPIMPWTTIDGLFFASLGLWLRLRCAGETWKTLGYALLGFACLCRQPFLAVVPAALLLLGDWRRLRYWIASASPLAAYLAFLAATGALGDAISQCAARSELFQAGLCRYFYEALVPWGAIYAFIAMVMILDNPQFRWLPTRLNAFPRLLGMAALFLLLAYCVWGMANGGALNIFFAVLGGATDPNGNVRGYYEQYNVSFCLFGGALGCIGYAILRRTRGPLETIGMLAVATAWCASLSLGYNSPSLALAVFVPLIAVYAGQGENQPQAETSGRHLRLGLTVLLALSAAWLFFDGRRQVIYRDRPIAELKYSLDGVFPGAKGLWTGEMTNHFLKDLGMVVRQCGDRKYAVIPDLAAFWIRSPQPNPLSIDWAFEGELPTKPLLDRAIRDVDACRGNVIMIVQKINAAGLNGRESTAFPKCLDVRDHVTKTWRKIGETQFFAIYE